MVDSFYTYRAELVRVIDGDTIDVIIDLGFGIMFGNERAPRRLRLAGIDTPELRSKDEAARAAAQTAKQFVIDTLSRAFTSTLRIETIKTRKGVERQTFGRYVAKVWLSSKLDEWECLNDLLVTEGHAKVSKG